MCFVHLPYDPSFESFAWLETIFERFPMFSVRVVIFGHNTILAVLSFHILWILGKSLTTFKIKSNFFLFKWSVRYVLYLTDSDKSLKTDHYLVPYALMEYAILFMDNNKLDDAKTMLDKAK